MMPVLTDRRTSWAIAILVLLVLFLVLSRCSGSSGSTRVGAVPNGAGAAEPAPITGEDSRRNDNSEDNNDNDDDDEGNLDNDADQDQGRLDAGSGTVTVDDQPLTSDDLARFAGRQAVASDARVLSVPADEGFWISTGGTDRVWVQLTGRPPESPYHVSPGDLVSFTGRITANGSGFARRVGVTRAEGATRLTAQRRHLNVVKRTLSLTKP